jgi:hypothetical protein
MLSLRRFEALAASYGADLQRWPEETRRPAQALLDTSAAAHALLAEARALDEAIEAESRHEASAPWRSGEQAAALASLRAAVASRIAPLTPGRRSPRWRLGRIADGAIGGLNAARMAWLGMATGSASAVAAGLLIGSLSVTPPNPDNLLAMLQPSPIHLFGE